MNDYIELFLLFLGLSGIIIGLIGIALFSTLIAYEINALLGYCVASLWIFLYGSMLLGGIID